MKKIFSVFLILSCHLRADTVFKFDEEEYRYLDQLALPCTDKSSSFHDYMEVYSHYFYKIKDKPIKFLEIGICRGGSVELWEKYFTNAELHFIDLSLDLLSYSAKRANYHLLDQSNVEQLTHFINKTGGQFDIILDDGGHTMIQQLTSFKTLFPHLMKGGLYIIEDLHTSYWPVFGGGKGHPNTTVEFLKSLVDDVNFIGDKMGRASRRQDLSTIQNELNIYRDQILGIHFYTSVCIIIKK